MSYADAAARGPSQTAEQVIQQEAPTQSLVDVDSPHVVSVPSSYSGETDTQMNRLQREAEQAEAAAKARVSEGKNKAGKAKDKAEVKAKKAKDEAKRAGRNLQENSDNPVVVGNFVVWTAIAAALGFGAYRQNQAGTLSWKVAGTWAGAVGLFAAGDYFLSRYLFQNKYPRK